MSCVFVWVVYSYEWYIRMSGIFVWVVYSYDWCIRMIGVFVWLVYSYEWCIRMSVLFVWVVYSYELCIRMSCVFVWVVYSYEWCIRIDSNLWVFYKWDVYRRYAHVEMINDAQQIISSNQSIDNVAQKHLKQKKHTSFCSGVLIEHPLIKCWIREWILFQTFTRMKFKTVQTSIL